MLRTPGDAHLLPVLCHTASLFLYVVQAMKITEVPIFLKINLFENQRRALKVPVRYY